MSLPAALPFEAVLAAASAIAFLAGAGFDRTWWRLRRRAGRPGRARPSLALVPRAPAAFDAAEQLRAIERAPFSARPLLNRGEVRLLRVLDEACAAEAPDWRVMAQVSLGEILASPDEAAYRAINTKRVDFLIVGEDGRALHAIELQGRGHHQGTAATRDAIKKEALRRAGIGYVEVVPGDTPAEVRALIAKLVQRERAGVSPSRTALASS
jgi:hypothetical protein